MTESWAPNPTPTPFLATLACETDILHVMNAYLNYFCFIELGCDKLRKKRRCNSLEQSGCFAAVRACQLPDHLQQPAPTASIRCPIPSPVVLAAPDHRSRRRRAAVRLAAVCLSLLLRVACGWLRMSHRSAANAAAAAPQPHTRLPCRWLARQYGMPVLATRIELRA